MARKYYDLTMEFSADMLVYPGDPEVKIVEEKSISGGDLYNLSIITFGSHTGTHIDAPKHLYDDGLTVDKLPLDFFLGKAKVFEIKGKDFVTADDLKDFDIRKGDIILLKTKNSDKPYSGVFNTEYAYLAPDAAEYLCIKEIKTMGFDYLSVENYNCDILESHYLLLKNGIVIIEGLLLQDVAAGEYEICALPMKIKDGNGSPVRAVLIQEV